MQLEQ